MTDLIFKLDGWSLGSPPPELFCTYTRMVIQVGETVVSRLNNRNSNSVSDSIYLPAYPLAAWIAANWWRLLYDCNKLRDTIEYEFAHNLKFAGEGYFLPDILIEPDGANMAMLTWHPYAINGGTLSFIETGYKSIGIDSLQRALFSVVNAVLIRLQEQNIVNTALQQDWDAVCNSTKNNEEKKFCIACARLGRDPYDIDEEFAENVIDIYRKIDSQIHLDEVFSSTNSSNLHETSEKLCALLKNNKLGHIDKRLEELREICSKASEATPWNTGYAQAKIARQLLHQYRITPKNLGELTAEYIQKADVPDSLLSLASPTGFIAENPAELNSFVLGRMLGAFICSADRTMPITEVYTAEQKRQRAFSAELYVPAEELRQRFAHVSTVGEDTVTEIAEEYEINPLVVKHQLENHRIAQVI